MFSFGKSLTLAAGLATVLFVALPAYAAVWIPGHYGPGGHWIPGHWGPGPGAVVVEPPGAVVVAPAAPRVWVPAHYGPGGVWIAGHWAVR